MSKVWIINVLTTLCIYFSVLVPLSHCPWSGLWRVVVACIAGRCNTPLRRRSVKDVEPGSGFDTRRFCRVGRKRVAAVPGRVSPM
jgi:hypothetical protein